MNIWPLACVYQHTDQIYICPLVMKEILWTQNVRHHTNWACRFYKDVCNIGGNTHAILLQMDLVKVNIKHNVLSKSWFAKTVVLTS